MSDAEHKIVAGLKEAVSVARGDIAAASITVNGHTYYSATALRAARASGYAAAREQAAKETTGYWSAELSPYDVAKTIAARIRAMEAPDE